MKHYALRTIPQRDQRYVSHITCDLCQTRSHYDEEWSHERHTSQEVTLEYKEGKSYPGDAWGTLYRFDLCPDCFCTKLVPWMTEQGAELQAEKYG